MPIWETAGKSDVLGHLDGTGCRRVAPAMRCRPEPVRSGVWRPLRTQSSARASCLRRLERLSLTRGRSAAGAHCSFWSFLSIPHCHLSALSVRSLNSAAVFRNHEPGPGAGGAGTRFGTADRPPPIPTGARRRRKTQFSEVFPCRPAARPTGARSSPFNSAGTLSVAPDSGVQHTENTSRNDTRLVRLRAPSRARRGCGLPSPPPACAVCHDRLSM